VFLTSEKKKYVYKLKDLLHLGGLLVVTYVITRPTRSLGAFWCSGGSDLWLYGLEPGFGRI